MKAVLEILPVDLDAYKCTLVFEINHDGFSYAIKDDNTSTYIGIVVFHFDKSTPTQDYSIILQNELQQQPLFTGNFKTVYVIHSIGESVLIPFSLYSSQENTNVLNLIHGDLQSNVSVITDIIAEKTVYNTYRVSTPVISVIKSKFPGAISRHQYTILLKQEPIQGDKLLIIFYPKRVTLLLNKNGITRFINTFSYDTSDDVLYILLNTCKQFEVENIPVEISGMIEVNSQLSTEIHKYFNSVSFSELPAGCNYSQEIANYPSHYFSHIFAIHSCE